MILYSFVAAVIFSLAFNIIFSQTDGCHLNVSNDGPVTLDVPVTVSAQVTCARGNESYHFKFESDTGQLHEVVGNGTSTASFVFGDDPGVHVVRVQVYSTYPVKEKLASDDTSFDVEEYIPGSLNVEGSVSDQYGKEYIAAGVDTRISLDIHYPRNVLLESEFAYSWSIGEERLSSDQPSINYTFGDPAQVWIHLSVVGRIPSHEEEDVIHYKWGHFDKEVTVKNPFSSLNISGNTYLEHGQLLDLDVSCNGSGPVGYCWKVLPSSENHTNLSCTEASTAAECTIPILYYFRDSGDFQLAIYVTNLVSSMQRNIEVHIYDVSLRPQLSTVIIPVVCSVLVVLIIAMAVVVQMRRKLHMGIVETADFDFMKEPTAVAVETSWEVMWRSLRCLLCQSSVDRDPLQHYGTVLKDPC